MGVFVPAVNTLEVALHITDTTGDDNVNTFWVSRTAAWTPTLMDAMLSAFVFWFQNGDTVHTYQNAMSSSASLTSVTGRDFTTQHGMSRVYQTGLPVAGTGSANAIAAGTTKALTARTGLAGKSYRGRTFLAAVDALAVPDPDDGLITGTYVADAILAFNSLIPSVTSIDALAKLVVASRYYQPGGPNTPTVPRATAVLTPITSYGNHDLFVDFQRRRAPGHARHR
jgi:hypothetical protein